MTIYNFAAGPAVLPKEVLKKAQAEFLDYASSGMSIMEVSHRGKEFKPVIEHAEATLRELMKIPDNYRVLFLQGGASLQFSMLPLNLALGKKVYYAVSGIFGKKAYMEAVKLSKQLNLEPILLGSTEESHYDQLVKFDPAQIDSAAAYVHLTMNNTIEGTTIYDLPDTNGVTVAADMSSDILAVDYDVKQFGLIYAGAQKNLGPAGLTLVIIREDLLNAEPVLSSMLDYRILSDNGSLYNTPPTFAIYLAGLVFDWVKSQGGVAELEKKNREKAGLLYDFLDKSNFYSGPVKFDKERSICNVPFFTKSPELDAEFVKLADAAALKNIKGHRSFGGMRASIYNAFPREGVVALIDFMKKFEEAH